MPGLDGTGPQGNGPMTGRTRGYCVLRESNDGSDHMQGFAGVQGTPVDVELPEGKEVTEMPFRDGTGPVGLGPMRGRAVGFFAGYPVPRYGNPVLAGGVLPFGVYGAAPYGYRWPWWARGFRRPRFGRAFGRGRGWGCGRGRFGFSW
jgi:hypothetical protein